MCVEQHGGQLILTEVLQPVERREAFNVSPVDGLLLLSFTDGPVDTEEERGYEIESSSTGTENGFVVDDDCCNGSMEARSGFAEWLPVLGGASRLPPWWGYEPAARAGSSNDEGDSKSFSDEDWERLNRIIWYKENTEYIPTQQDMKLMQFYFEIRMKHNASKLTIDGAECLADLSCEDFCCNLKMYPEAKVFDLKLGSYKLLSPYGLLSESASVVNSLVGVFSYKPFDEQLDWSFTARASPCYITYLKDSIDQIVAFFKSSPTISQTLALETAPAVQMTLDEVNRTAQEQMTRV